MCRSRDTSKSGSISLQSHICLLLHFHFHLDYGGFTLFIPVLHELGMVNAFNVLFEWVWCVVCFYVMICRSLINSVAIK